MTKDREEAHERVRRSSSCNPKQLRPDHRASQGGESITLGKLLRVARNVKQLRKPPYDQRLRGSVRRLLDKQLSTTTARQRQRQHGHYQRITDEFIGSCRDPACRTCLFASTESFTAADKTIGQHFP